MDWELIVEVLSLRNYNTRLVVLSTVLLGVSGGLVGSFLLLRKRSLMSDTLSHACLPGVGLMFIIMTLAGGTGKYLPGLLLGAIVTGLLGVGLVMVISSTTRIKDDAAMGIVLSVFFGLGVAILGMAQGMPGANAAGLEGFIYGKTASLILNDFYLLAGVTVVVGVATLLFKKEIMLLCFDEGFASSEGWPVILLDIILLLLVAAVTVVGLQAVGLILIIAFLITPASAARFWTHDYRKMLWLSALIGGTSGWLGASVSALSPGLPAGAVIVLVAAGFFLISMFFGSARGVLLRFVARNRLRRKVGRQHLLRAVFEILEQGRSNPSEPVPNQNVSFSSLLGHRSWSPGKLKKLIRRARFEDHVELFDGTKLRLSESGMGEAARYTRNHRLWELYLIRYADVAARHVDRDADRVEHVLGPDLVRQLENELVRDGRMLLPPSPHILQVGEGV